MGNKFGIKSLIKIIALILLLVFEGILSLVMTQIAVDEYTISGTLSYGIASVVAFYLFTLITLAELIRMMLGREHIILPMLGMYLTAFVLGISAGLFADYFTSGDGAALGGGITFAVFTLLLVGSAVGLKLGEKTKRKKKAADSSNSYRKYLFTKYDAEWYWEDVLAEYCDLHISEDASEEERDVETGRILEANADEIYVYCCNRIAYLVAWLIRRGGIRAEVLNRFDSGKIEAIQAKQSNPAELVYYAMDGKVTRDDIEEHFLEFLDQYYEYMGYGDVVREVCFDKDYAEIVQEIPHGDESREVRYCVDFSWEKYDALEMRLNERLEKFIKDRSGTELVETGRKVYSETFAQELEVRREELFVGFFPDVKRQLFDGYVERCLQHVARFPLELVDKICDKFVVEWGDDWVGDDLRETFLSQIGCGEIDIYYPHGDEIAYVLLFEADFESEHGISVGIRGDEVTFVAYRMDSESPWT